MPPVRSFVTRSTHAAASTSKLKKKGEWRVKRRSLDLQSRKRMRHQRRRSHNATLASRSRCSEPWPHAYPKRLRLSLCTCVSTLFFRKRRGAGLHVAPCAATNTNCAFDIPTVLHPARAVSRAHCYCARDGPCQPVLAHPASLFHFRRLLLKNQGCGHTPR